MKLLISWKNNNNSIKNYKLTKGIEGIYSLKRVRRFDFQKAISAVLTFVLVFGAVLGFSQLSRTIIDNDDNVVTAQAQGPMSLDKLQQKYEESTEIKAKYQLEGASLKRETKSDPKDRIEVIVGEKELGEFVPNVKISRWDEVSFKIKPNLDGIKTKDKDLKFEGEKIKFSTPKMSYEMYEYTEGEGGYKFIWYLNEKPKTNKVEFQIETSGLDFFYQPPLTQEFQNGYSEEFKTEIVVSETQVKDLEGNVLVERPENVVGSYAVYTSEQKTNWVGGKEYKAGKFGHIFRPKLIDAEGKETWGILNIDVSNGVYSVEIPQEFLDTARFPIKSNDNFGYEIVGGTYFGMSANRMYGSLFTSPADAVTAESLSIYLWAGATGYNVKGVLVLHSSLGILSNGVGNPISVPVGEAFRTSTFGTQPSLSGNTGYVLMAISNVAGPNMKYDTGDAEQGHYDNTNSYTTPTNPEDAVHNDYKYSIYCTYTAAAPSIQFTLTSSSGAESVTPASLELSLSAASGQNVSVDYAVTGTASSGVDYTLVDGTATITAGNTTTTINATIVDDALDELDETIIVTISNPTNATLGANTVHTYTIQDNDAAPTVSFTNTPYSHAETGTQTISVTISSASGKEVSVNYTTSDGTATAGADYTATSGTLTWSIGETGEKTFNVVILEDNIDENNETVNLTLSSPSNCTISGDNPVTLTITDNDTAGITVNPTSGLTTTEAGGTDTFTVVLNSEPTADVSIGLSSSDTSEGAASPSSLTFTSLNWNTPQTVTVTGVDDDVDDGDVGYTIVTAPASSTDLNYNGINPSDVSVTNTDNDTAGVTVTESAGSTDVAEGGATDTYDVVLTSEPTADVIITISPDSQATTTPASLTFASSTWNTAQTVTATAVDDAVAEGSHTGTITHSASSTDSNYNSISISNVVANITDNDTAGITVDPTSGLTTTEAGGTDTFTVVLNTQPTADVSIGLSSSDTSEGAASPSSLTFTSLNWNTPQTVTVTGADDYVDDGDIAYTIVTAAASSTDLNYNGLNANDVSAINSDNDEPAPSGGGMPSAWFNPPSTPAPSPENPQGGFRILINNGTEYTNTLLVTLNLITGPNTERMAISNFSDFRDAGQEAYASTKTWDLCKGFTSCPEGEYTVYVKFYAPWGRSSEMVSDSIIYKKEVPIAKLPPPEVKPPTEEPKKPFIERVPEILKPLIPEIFKPEPPEEIKPPEVPIEELVPKEAPSAFQGKWQLLSPEPIREFVLAPLPKEIRKLAEKFPGLGETFEKVGITKITDIEKLKTVKLTLPGLTERMGLPTAKIEPGKFALPQGVPVAQLSPEIKKAIPSDIVFAKTGGELIDFNIALSVTEKGEPQQKITTISGKPLQLVVKPEKPVKSVKGYVVFKSKKPTASLFQIPLSYLSASLFFTNPVFAQPQEEPVRVEEKLVLLEFEYTDPDGDGIYTAEIQAPLVEGEYEIITVMDFEDPELGKKEIRLITVVDPEGYVYRKEGKEETRIVGSIVSFYWLNPETKQYELWPAKEYQQENPQITDVRGTYSFLVPEGIYYLKVEAPGYLTYEGESFQVKEGSGIHQNIELKKHWWWLKAFRWERIILVLVVIFLIFNFYRDRMRDRIKK